LATGLNSNALKCPFQFDALYAFDKTKEISDAVAFEMDDDDDDDDDDGGNKRDDNVQYDCFGDVKLRLKSEKCVFKNVGIDDEKGNDVRRVRLFTDTFKKFQNEQVSTKYKGKEFEEYPRNHRFCSFLDRRKPDDGDKKDFNISKKDELIFYEPPSNCNVFPKDKPQPMFYFDTSRTCIIPNVGYKNGKGKSPDLSGDQKKKLLQQPLTSQSPPSAASILLSFHVVAADEIRCYMYINGQIMRFMPSDIITLLPRFFDKEFGDNAKFPQSDRAKKMVDEMNKNLRDVRFAAFMKKYQSKQSN